MTPKIVRTVSEMNSISLDWSGSVGFVPTMGFLHEGHLSLVKTSKKENNITVVSIYVNPSQFGANEDLSAYPRDLDRDIKLLADAGVDYVFFPNDKDMYPENYKTWINVENITGILCGKSRPSHFKGVTTIVAKLLNIVKPDNIYLGEKDYQQLIVLRTMVRDLNMHTQVVGCPIIREANGLAMSSRNKYLTGKDRNRALCLYRSLQLAQKLFSRGEKEVSVIKSRMSDLIQQNQGLVDYIEFIDPDSLTTIKKVSSGCRIVLAVNISGTRLIDNCQIK